MNPPPTTPQVLPLTTQDGCTIRATVYPTAQPARAHLVVAGATGVPQGYYRRFAEYASARGYRTMTLDYRGIGLSAPPSLKGFRMDYLDWARQDLAAAVQAMASPDLPLVMVGHSYGGHAFGLLPNHDKVAAFYTFATGAGWHGWMPPGERLKVWMLWNLVGPLATRWKGYLPWRSFGMGEDLPLDVYRQWRRWCQFPRYFFDDPQVRPLLSGFHAVRTPILAANALDDWWAQPRSRDAFMAGYRNAAWQALDIDPARAGLGPIGHMGYFRAHAAPLWDNALRWLEAHAGVPGAAPQAAS
ncbi:MAG: alpha/beta fold hydrolase [Rhodoferax sp.]|nr:alpha/beta fold hydrolase [Rhodoferax sp.]